MHILYSVFIYPFEWSFLKLLLLFYNVTGSYGISTIILSLLIGFTISPLAKKVLKITEKSKQKKIELQPYVKKIKEMGLKRAKRLEMVDSLYRQCGYNPLSELLGIIPVLMQLPLLLGMYKMVSHNADLFVGHSFFIISDFSKPDAILWGVNLLPILMTVINIIATFIMPNVTRSELIQAIFLAFMFLILLYPCASILLFYWTLNNLFMLLRMTYFNITKIHKNTTKAKAA